MMNGDFKDIILEDVYDELCDRYQYAACPPKNKQQNSAKQSPAPQQRPQPKQKQPPKPPQAPKPRAKKKACGSQPQTAQTYGEQCPPGSYFCTDAKKCKPIPDGQTVTDAGWLVNMSEFEFEFARCERGDGSFYGTGGQCRLGVDAPYLDKEGAKKLVAKVDSKAGAKSIENRAKILLAYEQAKGPGSATKLAEGLATTLSSTRERGDPTAEEVKALQEPDRQKKLIAGFKDPKSMQIGGENAVIPMREVSDSELEAAWTLMPSTMKSSMGRYGHIENAWQGTDEDGNDIHGGKGNPARGKVLLRRWLEQDGKDAYTGLPLTLADADLEHVKPHGVNKEKAETPNNWLWVANRPNAQKKDLDMDVWLKTPSGVKNLKEYEQTRLAARSRDAAAAGKGSKLKAASREKGFLASLAKNNETLTDSYVKAGKIKYIARALSPKFIDAAEIPGTRGGARNFLKSQATFSNGKVKGKMQLGAWISRNYPNLTASQQARVTSLYTQAANELKSGNGPRTAGAFAQRVADLFGEETF